MSQQALEGIKVVEWGSFLSAPFCTLLLGRHGAEVVKVEPPEGDIARRHPPFPDNVPHIEKSGLFLWLNAGKLGVTLDVKKPAGVKLFKELVADADVLVENNPLNVLKGKSLDYENLRKINPKLIMLSISPYGRTGPYKEYNAYHINCCSLGGISYSVGLPEREPISVPYYQGHFQAGLIGATSILFSLLSGQGDNDEGTHIDLGEVECWSTFHVGIAVLDFLLEQRIKRRAGHRSLHRPYPNTILPCKDGFVSLDLPQNRQWERLLKIFGNPSWGHDPMFNDRIETMDNYADKADALLVAFLRNFTKKELFNIALENHIPVAPVMSTEDVLDNLQFASRKFFTKVEHPQAGTWQYPGAPYKMSETPVNVEGRAPLLGEHNKHIFCERLGHSGDELIALHKEGII